MSKFPKCPECGSDKASTHAQGSMGGVVKYRVTCHDCCKETTIIEADPHERVFGKYSEKDLVEMLVAVGLLTTYPETIAYVQRLQKDLEAAIDRLGG